MIPRVAQPALGAIAQSAGDGSGERVRRGERVLAQM